MLSSCLVALGSGRRGLNMRCFCQADLLGKGFVAFGRQAAWRPGCNRWMVSSSWLVALSCAVAVSSDCLGLGLWLRVSNRRGFCFVDVKVLGFKVCGSNWYLFGGMSGRRLAMPRGLPSLRWSTEPNRRKIVVVAGVEEATCSSTSAPSVSQPIPEIASGRSDAPLLRPSTRGDRSVALSSASTFPGSRICTLGKVLIGPCVLREHSVGSS